MIWVEKKQFCIPPNDVSSSVPPASLEVTSDFVIICSAKVFKVTANLVTPNVCMNLLIVEAEEDEPPVLDLALQLWLSGKHSPHSSRSAKTEGQFISGLD